MRNPARGAAPASGLKFQAAVTAIAAVHLFDGSRIGWLDDLANDIPLAVWAESGGPGDDLRLELSDGIVEIQVKRGLSADGKLWEAMLNLARGLDDGRIDYGVLAVSPDSSRTVTQQLEQDLRHIGDGRTDRLRQVGRKWIAHLEARGLDVVSISRSIRIQTIAATDGNVDAVRAAKTVLIRTCGSAVAANMAWQTIVEAAHALIARKGRWDSLAIVRLLAAANVPLDKTDTPSGLIAHAIGWTRDTNQTFTVLGAARPVPLDAAWITLSARLIDRTAMPSDPAAAIARYRGLQPQESNREREEVYDAEFLGRFKRTGVIVAGPGLGKSTLLRRHAQRYANDGYPVLKVQLRRVAGSLATGETFETAVIRHGLDGSGIDRAWIANVGADGWVLLADGLDECGPAQDDVADGLERFSRGHPACRIIVTTRPIGYETTTLSAWPHYELIRPDSSAATAHVGRLVAAIAPDGSALKIESYDAVSPIFHRNTPANAVATDPQLMGMAASLIVRGEPLGRSKVELFQRLFLSVERSVVARLADGAIDPSLSHAVLYCVGWWVTAEPLSMFDTIIMRVADDLASFIGMPRLATVGQIRAAIRFWERVGVVERIHHRHTSLLAFVHKSFGEYGAARHLVGMDAVPRETELNRIATLPEWAEVLAFTAGLGLGKQVVEALLWAGELMRAIEIAADPAIDLPHGDVEHLTARCFAGLESGTEHAKIGAALATLAARYPAAVGPNATERIDHTDENIRRIAWACAVEAGPDYHDPELAAKIVLDMLAREGPGVRRSLLGGIRLMHFDRFDIVRHIALTNLGFLTGHWGRAEIETHVERLIADRNATTVSFIEDVARIVKPLGITPRRRNEDHRSIFDMMRRESDYGKAEIKSIEGLLDGIEDALDVTDVPAEPLNFTLHPPLQLSGLIRIIGFWSTPGNDVWAWTKSYERAAVAELLRIVIALSDLEPILLAREAATMRRKLSEEPKSTFFWALTEIHHVDIDDPDWERLDDLMPDLALVERALGHESVWVVQVATEILAQARTDAEHVAQLLRTTSGLGFASAGYLANKLGEPTGSSLIVERLEGAAEIGMRHLFHALALSGVGWTERVAAATEPHLLGSSYWTACAAADWVLTQVEAGADIDPDLLRGAYRHWQMHEPRQQEGSGTIPDSPRDALFKALVALDQVDDTALIAASADHRHDISKLARDRLIARAAQDPAMVRLIGRGIDAGSTNLHLTRQLLSAEMPLDRETVEAIVRRLEDVSPAWRLVASGILRTRYLTEERIRASLDKLMTDEHAEIRDAASRLNANLWLLVSEPLFD